MRYCGDARHQVSARHSRRLKQIRVALRMPAGQTTLIVRCALTVDWPGRVESNDRDSTNPCPGTESRQSKWRDSDRILTNVLSAAISLHDHGGSALPGIDCVRIQNRHEQADFCGPAWWTAEFAGRKQQLYRSSGLHRRLRDSTARCLTMGGLRNEF